MEQDKSKVMEGQTDSTYWIYIDGLRIQKPKYDWKYNIT